MKAVLQTRCVGMAPDSSGHALAPPEYVYECREPERVRPSWALKIWALLTLAGFAWMVARAVLAGFTG